MCGLRPTRVSKFVSRRRLASKLRSILPSSTLFSPRSQQRRGSSGCSRWCWGTVELSERISLCIRTCQQSCGAISQLSRFLAALQEKCSTTGGRPPLSVKASRTASSTIASLSTWRATTVFTQGHANLRRDPNGMVALLRQACVIDHQNGVLSPDGPVGLNSQFRLKRTGIPMPSEMK